MQRFLLPSSIVLLAAALVFSSRASAGPEVPPPPVVVGQSPKVACVRIPGSTEHYTEEGIQKLVSSGRTNVIMIHKLMFCGW